MSVSDYIPVIGLEIHSELLTKSKVFCTCSAEFGGERNTRCCPVCSGMPGTLPVINQTAVEYAVRAGYALGCSINKFSVFDAGKLIHDDLNGVSLCDYNRCGVPLIEIVTEPDMSSPEEARTLVETISLLLQYTGVSDCKMEQGSIRADVNVSLMRKGDTEFGTRAEIKNVNSLKSIYRTIEFEIKRQAQILDRGGKVVQETRRFDANRGPRTDLQSTSAGTFPKRKQWSS